MESKHTREATSRTPALIIYLIDISGSMGEAFEGSTKIGHVNRALESILRRMVQRSTRGELVSPRYRLAMAAYSDTVTDMLGGIQAIDEVARKGNPILSATNRTNTHAAFVWAREILHQELPRLRGCPAPMVCHLTDGEFTTADPEPIAREIMSMSNDDGPVLLENIFVGGGLTQDPIPDPENWAGVMDVTELNSQYAIKLFDMSSSLPGGYSEVIASEGYSLRPGCRMLIPGNSSSLIELAFAMSGATPTT